jgi:hypothetical protein
MQKHNTKETPEIVNMEEILPETSNPSEISEISSDDLDDFTVPQMNVSIPESTAVDASHLISDNQYLTVLEGIMNEIKEDRKQVSDYIDTFADMVINDGDATTSSKEAFVNLVKIKTDLADKSLKIADLMTRLKLKNTYAYSGPHLNAMQQNNFNIGSESSDFNRKELIRAINHAKKKKE